jgi:excisionase family DNA binding protein
MEIKDLEATLTLLDAARAAGVHPATIRRAILRGELPHFRIFGKIRVRRDELEHFLFDVYPGRRGEK